MEFPKKIGPYTIFGTLGRGGFGQVYIGREAKTLINYALKVSTEKDSLKKEYKILRKLSQLKSFMRVYEYGILEDFDFMVMELLGKNLEYKNNDSFLSLQSISAIGIEILNRIEAMHNANIIHRDVKPSQFLLSNDKTNIYLVDYGMAGYYRVNNAHKAFKTRCRFRGSVTFASINNHMGFKQSRRDDLESLCYSLLYLIKGDLPWKPDPNIQGFKKWKIVLNQKVNVNHDKLFQNIPLEFENLLMYTRRLLYDQAPNYNYMRSLLSKFATAEKNCMNFDWFLYPERFNNVKSFVISEGGKSFLHIKNDGAEFVSKRREAKIDIKIFRKKSQSLEFSEAIINSLSKKSKKAKKNKNSLIPIDFSLENLSDRTSNTTKDPELEPEDQDKIIIKPKAKKSKKAKKNLDKKRTKTYENINNLESRAKLDRKNRSIKSPTVILPEITLLSQSSSTINNIDECLTPKNTFPEFLNKTKILGARDEFNDLMKNKPDNNCCVS
ncbi:hypothetical protein SteCoe_13218 [Stentor coeruleus]|uniref:Casein kinase I n=1 Tax=Stentor coeruleus TaxID=5963 RepID=A0A1R2C8W5_9CILI|nr:hypothetical protein SteCoe_13218 [Stentor coeruleus]